jgi:three-Cys-motif partner protein
MSQSFGGGWTEEKLEVMKRYFAAYARALKNQDFAKWYVDAFAGSGRRTEERASSEGQGSFFGEDESDFAGAIDGSVRIALKIDPPFERYVFVERSRVHAAKLQELKQEFPNREIDIRVGDANEVLQALATSTNWQKVRAAVFIDP